MTLNEYQKIAARTDVFDSTDYNVHDPAYVAKILGLVGEAGEVADKYKKIIRDKQGKVSTSDRQNILRELGDVLWYVALLAKYLGVPLEIVAQTNIDKLQTRSQRGTLHGSGDER